MNSEAARKRIGGVLWAPTLSSLVDCAAQRLGLRDPPLDAGDLISAAERRSGRRFRTREVETAALAAAIDACDREAVNVFLRAYEVRGHAAGAP